MERALARLAAAVSRRRRTVAGVWLVLVLASAWFSLHQTDRLSGGGWGVPGSEADRGTELLDRFPAYKGVRLAVFVESASPKGVAPALDRARDRLGGLDGILAVGDPIVVEGGRGALLPLRWSEELSDEDVFDRDRPSSCARLGRKRRVDPRDRRARDLVEFPGGLEGAAYECGAHRLPAHSRGAPRRVRPRGP